MSLFHILTGLGVLAVLAYLFVALLKPEIFP